MLGFDGLDPDLVSQFIDEGKLPNMQKLARQGALQRLETTPSADASAWASFATGANPGKHGVFANDLPAIPHGANFWTVAGQAGVRSSILTVPLTFPPADVPNGELLSGWPAPDLLDTPGTYSYFATDVPQPDDGAERNGGVRRRLTFDGDVARSVLAGPRGLTLPVSIFWNRAGKAAAIEVNGTSSRLDEGQWSKWIDVDFSAGLFSHQHGMVEFLLVHAGTSLAVYASPIHTRGDRPHVPFSSPASLSADLYERVGAYRTLGWAEPTAALDANLIDEAAFMDDANRAFDDRAQVILQRIDARKWDLLVGVVDTLDHVQHMMWRQMGTQKYSDAIEHIYRRADDMVGEVVKHVDPDTPILIVSAYGAKGSRQTMDLNRWLTEEGLAGKANATASGGIALSPSAIDLEDHLVARLTALLDPQTHQPIITSVVKRSTVYSGPYVSSAPNLQVGMAEGYRLGQSPTVLAPNLRKWSADHGTVDFKLVPGTLISSRPTMSDGPRVIDIAPTVLRYFGLPIPTETDGTPLF